MIGFALDRLWCETMGLIADDSKERPLRLVADVLERAGVPYALIGGVAVQLHTVEPRSTLDIDVAVPRFDDVPRGALLAAGFEYTGRHAQSDNWRAPATDLSQPVWWCNFSLKMLASQRRSPLQKAWCSPMGCCCGSQQRKT